MVARADAVLAIAAAGCSPQPGRYGSDCSDDERCSWWAAGPGELSICTPKCAVDEDCPRGTRCLSRIAETFVCDPTDESCACTPPPCTSDSDCRSRGFHATCVTRSVRGIDGRISEIRHCHLSCPPGFRTCSPKGDFCTTDVRSDPRNCGQCHEVCRYAKDSDENPGVCRGERSICDAANCADGCCSGYCDATRLHYWQTEGAQCREISPCEFCAPSFGCFMQRCICSKGCVDEKGVCVPGTSVTACGYELIGPIKCERCSPGEICEQHTCQLPAVPDAGTDG